MNSWGNKRNFVTPALQRKRKRRDWDTWDENSREFYYENNNNFLVLWFDKRLTASFVSIGHFSPAFSNLMLLAQRFMSKRLWHIYLDIIVLTVCSCFLLGKHFSCCSVCKTTQPNMLQRLESLSAAKVMSLERCFAAIDGKTHTSSGICNRDSRLCVEVGCAAC